MTLIARLAIPDNLAIVAQTPASPSIGEASETRATATPMVIASDGWVDLCAPMPDARPGDRWIIETNVLARTFDGINAQPKLSEDTATQWKSSLAKIMVRSCDGPSRRIIDAGYPIVVRGPVASIAVLAPGASADLTRNATTRIDGGGVAQLEESFETEIHAWACPLRGYSPPLPQLTYWYNYDAVAAADTFVFVVPRGARRLTVSDLDAAITSVQFWQGAPGVVAIQIGEQAVVPTPAETFDVPIFGSPTHIAFNGIPNGPGFCLMRWEIGP